MSTVSTAIQLQDRVSAPIRNIVSAIESVCSAFESIEQSMDGGFDASAIDSARAALSEAVLEADRLGDEIEQNVRNQDKFNEEVEEGVRSADGLTNSILGMVGAYASFQGIQKLVNLSDEYIQTSARLEMMNDGLQDAEELQQMIFASAQRSRGSYQATADAVAKLGLNAGDAFDSTKEIVAFSEQLNKQFVIAGTETSAMEGAMTQLVQALGAGALRGDELNSIFEAAPNLIQTIADYMEVPLGSIKELASEGVITAEIVKNAMLSASEETNAKFEQMPMTWGQVWTGVMNRLYMASVPILKAISWLAQNWSILEPIVIGVASALLIYLGATKGVELATKAWTAAQAFFNSVMALNPIFLIIMAVILLISLIYAIVGAINKVTGKTISATGVIAGALLTAVAFIWNLFLGLLDFILGIVNALVNPWVRWINFFGNLFNDPIGSIIHLFGDFADNILGVIENIAKALDKVFGSNLAGSVQNWRNGLNSMVEEAANKYGNGSYEKVVDNLNLSSESLGLKRWAYGDAYKTGYEWGANFGKSSEEDLFEGIYDKLGDISESSEETAENTKGLSDTQEDLAYLRDIAERDIINRYTTAEIKIEQTNHNSIASDMDIDGIMDKWNADFTEILETAAEGVHA
jgi:tape measure domain-containing protein